MAAVDVHTTWCDKWLCEKAMAVLCGLRVDGEHQHKNEEREDDRTHGVGGQTDRQQRTQHDERTGTGTVKDWSITSVA